MSSKTLNVRKHVNEAEERIRKYIRETPLEYSHYLSKKGRCQVYLKLENLQCSGSFKARGAFNMILSLPRKTKVITASSGNHGLAVAYALNTLGGTGTIYLPTTTTSVKTDQLHNYNVQLEFFGTDCAETEVFARNIAKQEGGVFISPYNDPLIIGGQGTIAIELCKYLTEIDVVLTSVGGGGLISGIAGYLKELNPNIEIIGCLPENSALMYESVQAGKIVRREIKPTLSDGTAGGIEPGAITFELCQKYIDHFIIVNEGEIAEAIKYMLEYHHMVVEGAAGVTVASFLKEFKRFIGKTVVLIICGGNIGYQQLKEIVCEKKYK
ncbi:MAG: threonine/serine dehydratase [Candidatus Heimdallarchaeota archaeon]|nr:MAG: threonine/serine dehydratase [Candidatus Heimdallarchaeota archaeon]